MPDGAGRPETTALAGLPEGYIKQEVMNFKAGARKGSEPNRLLQKQMFEVAANISDADLAEAAAYFASLKLGSNLKVVEADMVPQTFVTGGMLAALPEGGMEPIGNRIIEVPEDLERAEMRDPKTAYIAYVPPGSVAKGQALVSTGGGKTTACATCHGPDLHGQGDVPHIAGRSPSYVMRQLFDIQNNKRTASVTFMQQVVANLSREDMIAIAAYLGSREP
jgi:cytochrome c553